MNIATSTRRRDAGYSLVEVIVAMGLLSSVLIAILTLFVMGRANVYSGKQMTHAVSIATSVIEDLNPLNTEKTLDAFGIVPATTLTDEVTVAGNTYEDVIVRSTDDLSNDVDGYLDRWDDLIPQQRIGNAKITLVFLPRDLTDANDVTTAQILRVEVVVEWTEGRRQRNVVLQTSKLNRSA